MTALAQLAEEIKLSDLEGVRRSGSALRAILAMAQTRSGKDKGPSLHAIKEPG